MEFLLVERDAARRVTVARHLCRSGHRVTLASSLAEARDLLGFVRTKAECPSAVLIAEGLLGRAGAAFRADLAARFPDLAWVPVRPDVDLDWLQGWLERTVARRIPARPAKTRRALAGRRCLDVLLVEEDRRVRQEVTRRLVALGDRVVACASIAQARAEVDKAGPLDVLIAPAIVGAEQAISLFLAAQKRRPALRWIVPAQAPAATRAPSHGQRLLHSTLSGIDGMASPGRRGQCDSDCSQRLMLASASRRKSSGPERRGGGFA